jgi:monoamine oxidase
VISRRRFLQLSAIAPTLVGPGLAAQTGNRRIVIVGAGLAGLRTAELLRKAGREVIVLEARPQSGGRVLTIRSPFDEGLYGEAGAIRFSGVHTRVLRLARERGLTLVPFESPNGSPITAIGGVRMRVDEIGLSPFALKLRADERPLASSGLLEKYVGSLPADLSDPASSAYALWQTYDRQTWPDWLRSRGASAEAVQLMTLGGDSTELSALYVLRQYALLKKATRFFKIRGGMDQLPRALAQSLGDVVRYNAEVVRVDRSGNRVRVDYLEKGAPRQVEGSRLIFAIPFSTLRQIEVRPVFSPAKARIVRDVSYYPATRFLLQSRNRVWQDSGLNGAARTDRPAEIWDCSYDLPGSRGLLGATVGGAVGRTLLDMSPDECVKFGVRVGADAFPSLPLNFEKGVAYRWAAERWSRGAFVVFRPGQMTTMMPDMAKAEGRVHFAGEHTSAWMGWMEGALESAERVAREVMEAEPG